MATIIFGCDPGKNRDSFGFVGLECYKHEIIIRGAKRWNKTDYIDIEKKISDDFKKLRGNFLVIERNAMGERIYESLYRQYKLPVIPIYTSTDLKNDKKIHDINIMDKNEMSRYLYVIKNSGFLKFIKSDSKDMIELKRQISIFSEYKTDTGKVSFRAAGSDHDDLVMALILALHVYRKKFENITERIVQTVKPQWMKNDHFIDEKQYKIQSMGRSIWLPK